MDCTEQQILTNNYILLRLTAGIRKEQTNVCNVPLSAHHLMFIFFLYIQVNQKVSEHLMITIQNVTNNVQIAPRQSPDIY
jgi:hypothetical protein